MLPINFKLDVKTRLDDEKLIQKRKEAEKQSKPKKSNSYIDILEKVKESVQENLGHLKETFQLITDYDVLDKYIQKANEYEYIAIDTETTGLDPLTLDIIGLCLYFPGEKATYVPIGHEDYISGELIDYQLKKDQVTEILKKLTAKVIMHNAQYDIRVLKHTLNVNIPCWWDTQTAACILNENEVHKLKILHSKYISNVEELSFSDYFKGIPYKNVPIEYAYLYAANDAIDTFELYEFQHRFLNDNPDNSQDRLDLYSLFRNIEMPMVDVIVELEDNGVAVDRTMLDSLKDKYHVELDNSLARCYEEIDKYKEDIDKYKKNNPVNKLEDPINISSTEQLAILFYDILKIKQPLENKKARCVDKDVLKELAKDYPIAKSITDYRSFSKMTSTYIDNIYNIIHADGRVHTGFNALGAKTGRMSSSDPLNLQNIPARGPNKIIRRMFAGQTTEREVEKREDNAYILNREEEIQLQDGSWIWAEQAKTGDVLESGEVVKVVKVKDFKVLIGV